MKEKENIVDKTDQRSMFRNKKYTQDFFIGILLLFACILIILFVVIYIKVFYDQGTIKERIACIIIPSLFFIMSFVRGIQLLRTATNSVEDEKKFYN